MIRLGLEQGWGLGLKITIIGSFRLPLILITLSSFYCSTLPYICVTLIFEIYSTKKRRKMSATQMDTKKLNGDRVILRP